MVSSSCRSNITMAPKLYLIEGSAPARGVLVTAAAIGLELEKQIVDLSKKEHLSPDFIKLNPQHTVPTLVDGNYVLWESHAITPYLVDKYGKDDSLYPKDLQKRGTVNQRLHLDDNVVIALLRGIAIPIFFGGAKSVPKEQVDEANEVYTLLNTLLEKTKYIADNNVTIADFHLIASLSTLQVYAPFEETKHPRLAKWYKEVTALPAYQVNLPGLQQYQDFVKSKLEN